MLVNELNYSQVLIKYLGNVDNGQRTRLYFGDVLDSGGALTFARSKNMPAILLILRINRKRNFGANGTLISWSQKVLQHLHVLCLPEQTILHHQHLTAC